MKKYISILLTILLFTAFTGCSANKVISNNVPEPSSSSAASNGIEHEHDREFVFVCPFLDNEYWKSCIVGMDEADRELGTHTTVIGPADISGFPDSVPQYVEEAINMQPDGIILYAGLELLYPLIEEASEKGIPVIAIDSDAPDTSRIAYVGTDLNDLGYKAGHVIVELTSGSAKVGYVCTAESALNEQVAFNAFEDAVSDYNIDIVAVTEGGGEAGSAEKAVSEMLSENPDINAVFCTGAFNVLGAAYEKERLASQSDIQDTGNSGDFVLVGLDDVDENIAYLRKGFIDALLVQAPEQMGYESVHKLNEYITKGKLSETEYAINSIIVKEDNIDTYKQSGDSAQSVDRNVRVGYYSGDNAFQSGSNDEEHKSGFAYDYYQAIAPIAGWKYEYVYGTRSDVINKLVNGEVDIVAGIYKTDTRAEQMLFSSEDIGLDGVPRYFAVNHEKQDILDELDYAMKHISQVNPEFVDELEHKYFNQTSLKQQLTNKEIEYIKNMKELKIGCVKDNMPLSAVDDDGNPTGVIVDLSHILSTYMDIDVKITCYDSMQNIMDDVLTKELDIMFPVYSEPWVNENNGLRQTDTFINDRTMVVYKGTYTDDILDTIALSDTGMSRKAFMRAHYPNSELTYYKTKLDAFEALDRGEVRCVMGSSNVMHVFMARHPNFKDMKFIYTDTSEDIGMAVSADDSMLAGIINKAIASTDTAVIMDSILRYSAVEPEYTLETMIQHNALPVVAVISAFMVILLVVFIGYFRKSRIFNEQQALTNQALEEALVAANSANEAKTTFLSSMSHDIRTPMNAIIGMTTVAEANIDDKGRVKDCLEKIERSGKYLITLINDVLDISKIESGKLMFNPTAFSIKDAAATLVNVVRQEAREKNIKIETNIHDIEHEMLYADEVRVNQIYMNILSNAVKYTQDGGSVYIEIFEKIVPDDTNVEVTYIVKDTGIGMSEEFMKTMYDTFSRADDGRVGQIQGTGLGLSIVKQMVDLMNGTIECESTLGKGTAFTVVLNLPAADTETKDNVIIASEISGLHILVAEDYDLNFEVIHELLGMHNITADWARNGQECIDIIKKSKPGEYSLILMDIRMPVMDGRTATRLIRADENEYVKNIPIIAMSADAFAEDIADSLAAGINGHLSKPVDVDVLLQEISKVLGIGGGYEER